MVDFFLFLLASIGLSHILVDGTIMIPLKAWLEKRPDWLSKQVTQILGCYQCSGFWSAVGIGLLLFWAHEWGWVYLVIYGLAGSFCSTLGAVVINYFNIVRSE